MSSKSNNSMSLSATERVKLAQVMEFAPGSSLQSAVRALRENDWDIQSAIESLLDEDRSDAIGSAAVQGSAKNQTPVDYSRIDKWFDELKDEDDAIEANGIMKLAEQLDIDPETDPVILVLAKVMNAKQMLHFSRDEFRNGMAELGCDSSRALKTKLHELRETLNDDRQFKELYLFLYSYALDFGQKVMSKEMALGLWKILLPKRFPLLKEWLEYFEKTQKHGVSKDLWSQFLAFTKLRGIEDKNYEAFDKIDAWPVVLDDFIASLKASK